MGAGKGEGASLQQGGGGERKMRRRRRVEGLGVWTRMGESTPYPPFTTVDPDLPPLPLPSSPPATVNPQPLLFPFPPHSLTIVDAQPTPQPLPLLTRSPNPIEIAVSLSFPTYIHSLFSSMAENDKLVTNITFSASSNTIAIC